MSALLSNAAVQLAEKGWRVFPLHGIVRHQCTCGKAGCTSPGKHPRIKGWQQNASSDPETVAAYWKKWPDSNIGVATGGSSRLFVVDIDGPDGEAALRALTDKYGSLPETMTVTTGRGRHLYFEVPGEE
ncbi:MAG TPA: bifunctional DNA primase/polymerase [Bryobacteraceae bacterium]|jgi:hypothetical protein|nr:bifunctional DNA primase/polymerase [Bryobacteraceae bacterium]